MIYIYGASDDLVEVEGDVHDELAPGRMIQVGTVERGVRVTMKYAASKKSGAVWRAAIEQIEEGVPMFPVTVVEADPSGFSNPRSYSVKVCIDCPRGTTVTCGGKTVGARRG